ncbi:MAG TPA: U32 family peptidase [Tepiditoga sp.]|nr:U32 family peptidase [Tepiditoga sp.]
MKKIELLSPAGNYEKLEMVFKYGADAAYLGGKSFGLRTFAGNFNDSELENAVNYAHSLGKKIYTTLNIIAHNDDLERLPEYVKYLEKIGVDAVIVADLGIFNIVRTYSDLKINVSTQASNTNWASVKMWKDLGASRIILARELSLDEIKEIRNKVPDAELEVFVHGAMCMSISGRCLLSNYLTGRDANRGACTQPCRWKYSLVEEKRPGEHFPIEQDENYTYIMNSKDLCTIEFIDKIIETGIDSIKIEGRMKGIYYGAVVTKIYREALEKYYSGNFKYDPYWKEELFSTSNRNFTSGFYYHKPDADDHNYETSSYTSTHNFVGKVIKVSGKTKIIEIRNQVNPGDTLEIIKPKGNPAEFIMPEMINYKDKSPIITANPNHIVQIETDSDMDCLDMLRKKI